jgi:hypothetical protein
MPDNTSFAGSANTAGKLLLAWSVSGTKLAQHLSRIGSFRRPSKYPLDAVMTVLVRTSQPFASLCNSRTRGKNTAWDGFVAINNADSEWSTTFMTGLPAGSYCNVIDGSSQKGTCTGTAYVSFLLLLSPTFNLAAVIPLPLMAASPSPLARARRSRCI